MGIRLVYALARAALIAVLCVGSPGPAHDAVASDVTGFVAPAPGPTLPDPAADRPAQPAPKGFTDQAAGVSFDPPPGWVAEPASALNPVSDPPDPAQELVRFQPRGGDASLYALPVPVTSALVRDAGAIIAIGVARAGGELVDLAVDPRADRDEVLPVAGFYAIDEERTFEGLHVLTRYLVARETDRRLVARGVAPEEDWAALGPLIRASLDSLRADPNGPNAPPGVLPDPVVRSSAAEPGPTEPQSPDPSAALRQAILDRAAAMLATPYVWGGNAAGRGMDCSAYVSAAWGVARYTTESIGWVSSPIGKDDLRPGDAMNLTIGRDPERFGHIRLFEAWANEAHTLVWVYEETPPRAVHRVVVYDDRYQPIRLDGLSGGGAAPLVPAPAPAPQPRFVPAVPRSASPTRQTPRPSRPTTRPATRTPPPFGIVTPRPISSPLPSSRPAPRPARTPTPAVHR